MTTHTLTPLPGVELVVDVPPDGLSDAARVALARQYASRAPAHYPRAFAAACGATAPYASKETR